MTDTRFPERWLNDRRIMRLSSDAFRLYVLTLTWSVANRTDGWMRSFDLALIPGVTPEQVQQLVDADLWEEHTWRQVGQLHEPVWMIVDFEETQTTSLELAAADAARRRARDKKRRQRAAAAGSHVPDAVPRDVPRDSTRTGQVRTGTAVRPKVNSTAVAAADDEVGGEPQPIAASASPTPGDADASIAEVLQAQHDPPDVRAGRQGDDRYAREANGHDGAKRLRIEKFLRDHPEIPRAVS